MATITWDPVNKGAGVVLTKGNLTAVVPTSANTVRASQGKSIGKWYWEVTFDKRLTGTTNVAMIGLVNNKASLVAPNYSTNDVRYYYGAGTRFPGAYSYGAPYAPNDIIGVTLDLDLGSLTFFKNGVLQGISHNDIKTLGEVFPAVSNGGSGHSIEVSVNFGDTPFKYPVPSGYGSYVGISDKSFILFGDGYKKLSEGGDAGVETYTDNVIPAMTSNTSPSGIASASGIYVAGYEAWRAFDKTTGGWISNSTSSSWIAYEFNSAKQIGKYTITNQFSQSLGRQPKSWTFEGWNGSSWIVLDTQTNYTSWVNGVKSEFTFPNDDSYIKYRINISTNNGDPTYLSIGEIEMMESLPLQPLTPPSWKTVSSTLPTLPQFQEEGIDDLSIFDRKVQQVLESPQAMTDSVLGAGKVFKGAVDLKKYFDLRKLEVK